MKKRLLLVVFAMMAMLGAAARPVDAAAARRTATAFLQAAGAGQKVELTDITRLTPYTEFYIFTMGGQGFVLVAADDCVEPILGYSLTNRFEPKNMPAHIAGWLAGYDEEIRQAKAAQAQGVADGKLVRSQGAPGRRETGEGRVAPMPDRVLTAVSPLLSTTWSQSPYYNDSCPYSPWNEAHAVTGCVATATAQIMKYWNHPTTGYGSHSYESFNFGTLAVNFGATTYAWSSMPTALSASSTAAQKAAVAQLMYHVGVAVEMNYGVTSSGAQNYNGFGTISSSAQTALMTHFKYKPTMSTVARSNYSAAEFAAILQAELDDSRPILFSGRDPNGGHSFVIDGYNNSGQFHVNWGWGSYCDGYYAIGSLNPAAGGTGGNNGTYNDDNVALIGIEPTTAFGTGGTVTATVSGGTAGCSVSGTGSYNFGDTVSLKASAPTGYRFNKWSDNECFNPREFIMNGGNHSLTAMFEPLSGDTLSYCAHDYYITSFGASSGTSTWGIRLPASVLTAGHDLEAVQLYVPSAGTYVLKVYTGTSSPSTMQFSATYNATSADEDAWQTLWLSTPVAIDATQALWITFECSDVDYPAALTYSSGNDDAFLWGSSLGSLNSTWPFSLMLRGIFAGGGSGTVDEECIVTEFPYTMGFEDGEDLDCWLVRDADGDGGNWGIMSSDSLSSVAYSFSWHSSVGGLTPDNWLIMPGMALPEGMDITMTWEDGSWDPEYYQEHYGIFLSTTDIEPESFSQLWQTTLTTPLRTTRTLDLSAYAGQTVYLAFRHYNSEDVDVFYIDNISIAAAPPHVPQPPTVSISGPTTLDEGQQATFTATVTGATTASWTLQGATPSTANGTTATARWNTPGTYRVIATATNSDGSASDTLTVTVVPLPQYTVTVTVNDPAMGSATGGGTYRLGTEVTLTARSNSGFHFVQWHDGLTDSTRTITVTADLSFTANFAENVGIDNVEADAIALQPNPATTSVALTGLQGAARVEVIDASGRIHSQFKAQNEECTLDVSGWARGAYFVRVATAEGLVVKKLILR